MTEHDRPTVSRRSLAQGAAWAIPAVAMVGAAPAHAASGEAPSTTTPAFCQNGGITLPDGSAPLPLIDAQATITSATATSATVASQWTFDISGAQQLNPAIASYAIVEADPWGYEQNLDALIYGQSDSSVNQGITPITQPIVITIDSQYALTEKDTARVGPLCGGMTHTELKGEFTETTTLDTYFTSSMSHHYTLTFYDASGAVVQVAGTDDAGNPIMMDSQQFGLYGQVNCPDALSSSVVCADAS